MMKKFLEEEHASDSFREELADACRGLVFSSERDAAVEPFFSEVSGGDFVLAMQEALGSKTDRPIEEINFEDFFGKLESVRDWYGPEEKRNARGYARLRKVLAKNLASLRVFRAGTVRIDIFIIGKDGQGRIAGIRTHAVET